MLQLDVVTDVLGLDPAVADVTIGGHQLPLSIERSGIVMLPLPVLELHAIDMAAIEEGHLLGDAGALGSRVSPIIKVRHEAVAGEASPVTGHIDGDGSDDQLTFGGARIDLYEVALKVPPWRAP